MPISFRDPEDEDVHNDHVVEDVSVDNPSRSVAVIKPMANAAHVRNDDPWSESSFGEGQSAGNAHRASNTPGRTIQEVAQHGKNQRRMRKENPSVCTAQ